jgi:hypothetical protein
MGKWNWQRLACTTLATDKGGGVAVPVILWQAVVNRISNSERPSTGLVPRQNAWAEETSMYPPAKSSHAAEYLGLCMLNALFGELQSLELFQRAILTNSATTTRMLHAHRWIVA